ncbi:MAG: sigma-70 family RNA polymerase sigma factor [Candidatus Brocadiae bacterium]|nr:sigma-70 family RNA polymerase sigma factor [Candidatus Brocadiia bacterium]
MKKEEISLEIYLKEIQKYALLSPQKERQLLMLCKRGDKKSREEIIQCNLRLVVNIAKRYSKCGVALSDLIAEGNIGLIDAIEKFDLSKQCRFSTYATWWIKHSICRAITEKKSLVRIPTYMKAILVQCKEKTTELMKKWDRMPTASEVVSDITIPDSQRKIVNEALITNRAMESMQSIQNLCEQNINIEDKRYRNEEGQSHALQLELILEILKKLDSKRSQIMELRYGLNGRQKMALKEIASQFSLSKERIRQMEKETLKMLKDCLKAREIMY